MKPLVNLCWFFFKWGAAAAVVAALVASPFYYRKVFGRFEEEIRFRVEAEINDCLPNMAVTIRSAHLASGGIVIKGLWLREREAMGPQGELAYIGELLLACKTSPQELLAGKPKITSVTVRRPVVRATLRPDGSYNLCKFLPLPKPSGGCPPVRIEDGTFEVFDPLKSPTSTFTLRDINVSIEPAESQGGSAPWVAIEGLACAEHVQRVVLQGAACLSEGRWRINGRMEGLKVCPELRDSLPGPIAGPLAPLSSVSVPVDLTFRASQAEAGQPPEFEVAGQMCGGMVNDPRVAAPLTALKGEFYCDNRGFRVEGVSARQGQTEWHVPLLERQGFALDTPVDLRVVGQRIRLDPALRDSLPEPWRTQYQNYDPRGEVNVDCTLRYCEGAWKPLHGQVTSVADCSFSYHQLPYQLENAQGSLTLNGNQLLVQLTAYAGRQPVRIDGKFFDPGPQFTGEIVITGERIPFDDKLFTSLQVRPKARETILALNPHGTFHFWTKLSRTDPQLRGMRQEAWIKVNNCSMEYDKFRSPVSDVSGSLHLRDGQWDITASEPLVGTHSTGKVICYGSINTSPGTEGLKLTLHGTNIPLGEDLRKALKPSEQQVWATLRPTGSIDFQANVSYNPQARKTNLDLWIMPRGDTAEIRPVPFPCRMEKLTGKIHYHDAHVELVGLSALHRDIEIATNGSCDFFPDGSWRLKFKDMHVDRIRLHSDDRELDDALPAALHKARTELHPAGAMNLRGEMNFARQGPTSPVYCDWDLNLFLHQASFKTGVEMKNIFGQVRLQGSCDGGQMICNGQLQLENLTVRNFHFTDVRGPLWLSNERVYLGAVPRPGGGWSNSDITAGVFGGAATARCEVKLGSVPEFHLIAHVAGADLRQFSRDNLTGHQKLGGKVNGNINLLGKGSEISYLNGFGDVHVTDADIYQLPVLFSLLKIVRAKAPDTNAFTQSDIEFEVEGKHVKLKQIKLLGDAIDLNGQGELTLDGQSNPVKLDFYSPVGRGNLPLLTPILSEASQQIMRIYVDGPLDSPTTKTEVLPAFIQADARRGSTPPPPPETRTGSLRDWWPFK